MGSLEKEINMDTFAEEILDETEEVSKDDLNVNCHNLALTFIAMHKRCILAERENTKLKKDKLIMHLELARLGFWGDEDGF